MTLSDYHQQFTIKSDAEIQQRINEKEQELVQIFKIVQLGINSTTVRVAVFGCADKRLIQGHKVIFEKVLNKKVDLTTFDISIEHLLGEDNVYQHDCTYPLPNLTYDITYSHVLLKFIPTNKQLDLIKNSFSSLNSGGIAIHILDKADYETTDKKSYGKYFTIPLVDYKLELDNLNIKYMEIPNKFGITLVLLKG